MKKIKDNQQANLNKAYSLDNDKNWMIFDDEKLPELKHHKTLCLRYSECVKGNKLLTRWKLILAFLKKTGFKFYVDKLKGYSNALIENTHDHKITHYIVLYFKNTITLQDLSSAILPLKQKQKTDRLSL